MSVDIKYALKEGAKAPFKGSEDAGWWDLHAFLEEGKDGVYKDAEGKLKLILLPNVATAVPTGFFTEIPTGYRAKVEGRSGLALKKTVHPLGGCVDSDYRGEWKAVLLNSGTHPIGVDQHDRVAQFAIEAVIPTTFTPTTLEELTTTKRGETGFGASGK